MMVFMGVMFYKVPSGLGIYFITSSLWAIGERLLLPKVTHATDKDAAGKAASSQKGSAGRRRFCIERRPRWQARSKTPRATATRTSRPVRSPSSGRASSTKLAKTPLTARLPTTATATRTATENEAASASETGPDPNRGGASAPVADAASAGACRHAASRHRSSSAEINRSPSIRAIPSRHWRAAPGARRASIVRLSGPKALSIAAAGFSPSAPRQPSTPAIRQPPRGLAHGRWAAAARCRSCSRSGTARGRTPVRTSPRSI